jgi:hypothetical protein
MRTVGWYTWGKTEKGYGWNLWAKPGLAIERDGKTGHYEVSESDGTLVCRCVSYRDAQKVVARLHSLLRAQVTPNALQNFSCLVEGKHGWIVRNFDILEAREQVFSTREQAEAHIRASELIHRGCSCH